MSSRAAAVGGGGDLATTAGMESSRGTIIRVLCLLSSLVRTD